MALTKEWKAGDTASIIVDGIRRPVEVIEVDADSGKVKVKRANGVTTLVYANALIQPGQKVHYRRPRVAEENLATMLNALDAEGYSPVALGGSASAYDGERLLVVRSVPGDIVPDEPAAA